MAWYDNPSSALPTAEPPTEPSLYAHEDKPAVGKAVEAQLSGNLFFDVITVVFCMFFLSGLIGLLLTTLLRS